jgi:pyrophosphatase PpaX
MAVCKASAASSQQAMIVYKTILFDFDGTLVSSLELWLEGFKHAFKQLGQDVTETAIIERCFYRAEDEIVASFNLPCVKTFWSLVEERLNTMSPEIFPGVTDLLAYCKDQNLKIGLVTSSEKSFVHRAFAELDIGHYFETVVTANDIVNFKPHPEPVLKALKRLGSRAEDTLFVGDNSVDVRAGKAAGVYTAVFFSEVHHGRFHKYNQLADCQPDYIFDDYSELKQQLEILLNGNAVSALPMVRK